MAIQLAQPNRDPWFLTCLHLLCLSPLTIMSSFSKSWCSFPENIPSQFSSVCLSCQSLAPPSSSPDWTGYCLPSRVSASTLGGRPTGKADTREGAWSGIQQLTSKRRCEVAYSMFWLWLVKAARIPAAPPGCLEPRQTCRKLGQSRLA